MRFVSMDYHHGWIATIRAWRQWRTQDVYGQTCLVSLWSSMICPMERYILEATVNAPSVDAAKNGKGQVFIEEDNYDNNTVSVRLQIIGDNVRKLTIR